MIRERSLDAAESVVSLLSDQRKKLHAKEESPLHQMVSAGIRAETSLSVLHEEVVLDKSQIINESRLASDIHGYEHDNVMKNAVDQTVASIKAQLFFAKNTVVGQVVDVLGRYQQRLSDIPAEAEDPCAILPNVYHDIWDSNELHGLTQRFLNVNFEEVRFTKQLPTLTHSEIVALFHTGMNQFDDEIKSWVEDQPEQSIVYAYNKLFIEGVTLGQTTNSQHRVNGTNLTRNDFLVAFLVASNFENNMPDGVNVELGELRSALATVMSVSGRLIAQEIAKRERNIASKYLIFNVIKDSWEYSSDKKTIVQVNNDVYLNFLKEGGSPEAIYGCALSDGQLSWDNILEKKEQYEKVYARIKSLHVERLSANILSTKREAVKLAMSNFISEMDVEELPASKDKVQSRVIACVDALPVNAFDDDAKLLRCLVCDVLYPDTNIGYFLESVDRAEVADPSMSSEECRLFATIDLITKYVANQMAVQYCK